MNKSDLIEAVTKVTCTKQEAEDSVNAVFTEIKKGLRRGSRITISGLGTFFTKLKRERRGRNPKTGQTMFIPERRVARFKPARGLFE